jgi:DNA-binding LytR/AlgR family response regulator
VNKDYCVISSIGNLLKEKTFETFLRIHRSYAVQKNFIRKITANTVFINDVELPIGRSYKPIQL